MYRFIYLSLFILLSLNSHSIELSFKGINKLTIDDIQQLTDIDINKKDLSEEDLNTIIQDLYGSELIFDIKTIYKSEVVIFDIKESNIIQNIYINNNKWIDDDTIIFNLSSKKNSLLTKNKVSNDLDLINKIYKTKGFENVSTVSKVEKFSNDRVNLIYQIYEGDQTKVNFINFIGNEYFSDKFLSSIITSQSIKFYNFFKTGSNLNKAIFNSDKNKIINFYKDNGYFDVKVTYSLELNNLNILSLNFYIEEGKKYKIDNIFYNSKLQELSNFNYLKNKFEISLSENSYFYSKYLIEKHLEEINNYISSENINNFFIDVNISNNNNDDIDLEFFDIKQNPSIMGKIDIYGNSITKDKTIRSKILIEPGDSYNEYLIEKSLSNIRKFSYINNINFKKELDQNNTNLSLEIDENLKTGNFLFAGTFDTDTQFGLALGLQDKNFMGSGNIVDTNFELNSENIKYDINLTQFPFSNPFLTNKYSLFNQDNDYTDSFGFESTSQGFGYNLNLSNNNNSNYGIGISYENINSTNAKDSSILAITENIGSFQNLKISLSISNDTTNDIFFPTKGHYNKFSYILSPNNLSDDPFYKIIYNNKNYFNIKNSNNFIFFNNNIAYAKSLNDNLLTVNAFSLGGNNFKGFDFRGIGPKTNGIYLGGSKLITSTIGYGSSFLFDEKDNINFNLFLTSGSLWDSDYSSNDNFDLRTSIGISIDLLTPVGPISFAFANPIAKNSLDKERQFTFSIGSSF